MEDTGVESPSLRMEEDHVGTPPSLILKTGGDAADFIYDETCRGRRGQADKFSLIMKCLGAYPIHAIPWSERVARLARVSDTPWQEAALMLSRIDTHVRPSSLPKVSFLDPELMDAYMHNAYHSGIYPGAPIILASRQKRCIFCNGQLPPPKDTGDYESSRDARSTFNDCRVVTQNGVLKCHEYVRICSACDGKHFSSLCVLPSKAASLRGHNKSVTLTKVPPIYESDVLRVHEGRLIDRNLLDCALTNWAKAQIPIHMGMRLLPTSTRKLAESPEAPELNDESFFRAVTMRGVLFWEQDIAPRIGVEPLDDFFGSFWNRGTARRLPFERDEVSDRG